MLPLSQKVQFIGTFALVVLGGCFPPPAGVKVVFPESRPGIGFDDLGYSVSLRKVLVPAGRSGKLDLVDPGSLAVTTIHGFQSTPAYNKGHDDGPTSADEGRGLVFVTDRTAQKILVVDPAAQSVLASAPLASGPDYVRYVTPNNEVWVTEPDKERIEVFALPESGPPTPSHLLFISVPGGPESLVVDPIRSRAYAHLWQGQTVAIDVKGHQIAATWPNGCGGSRGIALDVPKGWLFAACAEGKAVVLDVDHGGAQKSIASSGGRVDVVGYSPQLGHLYLATSRRRLMVFGVSAAGQLTTLGGYSTTGGRCVTADDQGNAWVCDPQDGRLLMIKDQFPKSGL